VHYRNYVLQYKKLYTVNYANTFIYINSCAASIIKTMLEIIDCINDHVYLSVILYIYIIYIKLQINKHRTRICINSSCNLTSPITNLLCIRSNIRETDIRSSRPKLRNSPNCETIRADCQACMSAA